MTRINLVSPEMLTDQHLLAEYRELPRAFTHAKNHPDPDGIPEAFCLGTGHVKFFKNKLGFLRRRHDKIKAELKRRNFQANMEIDLSDLPQKLFGGYHPTPEAIALSAERVAQRVREKPNIYKFRGGPLPWKLEKYESVLKKNSL